MFTGLIEEKGIVAGIKSSGKSIRLIVKAPGVASDVIVGESIAISGVCLTAVSVSPPTIEFDAVRETIERTTLGRLKAGDSVNLERALRLGDRLDGHMVQGHVDGIGVIREIRRSGDDTVIRISAEPDVMTYVVRKGSITVDGISLTIADVTEDWFSIAIIPHTLINTTLNEKNSGSAVNLETDIIGRYVYKYMGKTSSDDSLMKKLAEGGFLE
ncbi:MAG: riboflavin synthase [Armatimonadota bacterium]